MKTGIIYNRVSSIGQRDNGSSLNDQEKACRKYCKNNNIKVLWVFKEAFSWKQRNRPIFNEAIQNAIENNIKFFIIFDIDRFSREWYWVYSELKNYLSKNWIQLRDSKNIIWDNTLVYNNDIIDMWQYDWAYENTSQYAEVMLSTQANIEWKKVLQRTIDKEIRLEQSWYNVRAPNFWYKNKTTRTKDWRKTIQIKDHFEWDWVIEMFEKRAEWFLKDKDIIKMVNIKWAIKRKNKRLKVDTPLDVKYMQELLKNPIYCWVIKTKWTWYKAIRAMYEGLVSIDTWNKANKGKIIIVEHNDKSVEIVYKNKKDIVETIIPTIEKRKDYNNDYQYAKVLKCPTCKWVLTWNNARSKTWDIHKYYQCRWKNWTKHKNYTIQRKKVNDTLKWIFKSYKPNKEILTLFEIITEEVFINRKSELADSKIIYQNNIKKLKDKKSDIINNIDKVINFPTLLEAKNKELEDIEDQIGSFESKSENINNDINIDTFIRYSLSAIKHLDKLALQKDNPEFINLAFNIMFNERVVFENLCSPTPWNQWLYALVSQQKNPQNGDFTWNLKWQPH